MSGFLAVKSLVSPCIRIMSLLLTVAIVSVVWAIEGAEIKRAAALVTTQRTFLTRTSRFCCVSICPHVGRMFIPGARFCQGDHARFLPRRLHRDIAPAEQRRVWR